MVTRYHQRPELESVEKYISDFLDQTSDVWIELSEYIHSHPEIALEEHKAVEKVRNVLEAYAPLVNFRPHAYGIETALEATSGKGGRRVNFNAEYDALPGIGHACGHNLIAMAGVSAFVALSKAVEKFEISGRVQLLGTPAEETGVGKPLLIDAGAYKDVDASLMFEYLDKGVIGVAGPASLAVSELIAEFKGKSAHAAEYPWDGINALDAVVAAYNNISLLRQQIHPDERIHGAILQAPKITNAIPEYTKIKYTMRSAATDRLEVLVERIRKCIDAAGLATGCEVVIHNGAACADMRINKPLSQAFADTHNRFGKKITAVITQPLSGSTDMGNVSHVVPGLHAMIGIPTPPGVHVHQHEYTSAAHTEEAHQRVLQAAKALAITGFKLLTDDGLYQEVRRDFEAGK